MRKSVALAVVIVGLALGVAGGYVLAIAESASDSPFIGKRDTQKKGFAGVIEDFARLGGYESVAANCGGTSDTRAAIEVETQAVLDLEQRKQVDPNLLNVAQAKLLVRAMGNAEKDTSSGEQSAKQKVDSLLSSAGWVNTLPAHMQEIIKELDHDQCGQVVLGGGQ